MRHTATRLLTWSCQPLTSLYAGEAGPVTRQCRGTPATCSRDSIILRPPRLPGSGPAQTRPLGYAADPQHAGVTLARYQPDAGSGQAPATGRKPQNTHRSADPYVRLSSRIGLASLQIRVMCEWHFLHAADLLVAGDGAGGRSPGRRTEVHVKARGAGRQADSEDGLVTSPE